MVTTIRSGLSINRRSVPSWGKHIFFLLPSVQAGSGIHITFHSLGAESSVPDPKEAGVWKLPCTFPSDVVKRRYGSISSEYLHGVQGHNLTYYYCYRYSTLGPVWVETRVQSGDWYGSGTLHPGQVLRGSLPLLSPAFRRSHFRHQVPPHPPRRERS